jgi:hypothetical protein
MGKLNLGFRSVCYTIASLSLLFALALFLGFEEFGGIFSLVGFVSLAFLVFATMAD